MDDGAGLAFELIPYGQFGTLNPVMSICTNLFSTAKGDISVNRSMSRDGSEHYSCAVWAESFRKFGQSITVLATKLAKHIPEMVSGDDYERHIAKKAKADSEGIYSITFTKFSQF